MQYSSFPQYRSTQFPHRVVHFDARISNLHETLLRGYFYLGEF